MKEEVGLRDYFRVIRKRWKIVFITFLIVVIVSVVISLRSPDMYQATTLIKIGKVKNQPLESIRTIVEIFRQGPILREIAQDLKMPLGEENLNTLKGRIKMKDSAGMLQIIGEGETPEGALQLVNSITRILLERHRQLLSSRKPSLEYSTKGSKKLEDEIEDLRRKIGQLEKSGSQTDAIISLGYMNRLESTLSRYERLQRDFEDTKIVVSAELPQSPVGPKTRQNVLIASFFGIFLGVMFAFMKESPAYIFKK